MADLLANIRIRAFDGFSRVTNKLRNQLKQITDAQLKAQQTFQLAGQINLAAQSVGKFGRVARAAIAVPTQKFLEFEQAMANVRAVSGEISSNQFTKLAEKAKFLGGTTEFTSVQAAEGLRYLAIAGFGVEEQLAAIGPVLDLATAASTDLGTASDIASDLMGAFRLEASQMGDITDVLTATFTRSNTTLSTLFETMKLVGPQATDMGISMREVASMTAVLGSAGIKGSLAGTALRSMLQRMVNPAASARKEMRRLGLTVADAEGNLRKPTAIFQDLINATKEMGTVERGKAFSILFGTRAAAAMSNLVASMDVGKLQEFLKGMQNVAGVTQQVAAVQRDTG